MIPIQSKWGLITVGLGYLIFGTMITALFFFLDFADTDKDVHYSEDHAQYWLGLPVGLIKFSTTTILSYH